MHRYSIFVTALLGLLVACQAPPSVEQPDPRYREKRYPYQRHEDDLDLLFVVGNHGSMAEVQRRLIAGFAELIAGLRSPELGADGTGAPCSSSDRSGCLTPNLRVGVVSADLSDGGELRGPPSAPGCLAPNKPFIAYTFDGIKGVTNIPGVGADPLAAVADAFGCIAALGADSQGPVQPLEAARLALDPKQNLNPELVRPDALLAVVFVTDADDASLEGVDHYRDFFRSLKPPGRLVLGAIGPCGESPAPRLDWLVEAFAPDAQRSGACAEDLGPALATLGELIRGKLVPGCIAPPVTMAGELVCAEGDEYAPGKVCAGCLERVDCDVIEIVNRGTTDEVSSSVARCPAALWSPDDWRSDRDCGEACPCWRVVRKGVAECHPHTHGSPYGVDVLREAGAPGARVEARCLTTPRQWGTAALGELLACAE